MKTKQILPLLPMLLWSLLGFGAGLLNGLLGAAGGILLVAALPRVPTSAFLQTGRQPLHPADRRDIMATALCVMLPTSAISFVLYLMRGIRPSTASLMTMLLPAALGGLLGAVLLGRIPRAALKRIFALIVVISGVRMLFG